MVNDYNYEFYRSLFNSEFKGIYKKKADECFEKNFRLLGLWGYNKKNGHFGILTKNGNWDDLNRTNTHPRLCEYFCNLALASNSDIFIDLHDSANFHRNIKVLWGFIDKNFNLFFTTEITSEYYTAIYTSLSNSWNRGIISVIILVMCLHKINPEYVIEYSFETGCNSDFSGTDVKVWLHGELVSTIQAKSGGWNYDGDYYEINVSQNNFKYNQTHYAYSNVNNHNLTELFMFKNNKELLDESVSRMKYDKIIIPKELIEFDPIRKYMNLPVNLTNAMRFCGTHDIIFSIIKIENGESSVTYIEDEDGKTLTVKILNLETEESTNSISTMVEVKLKELKETFN